MSSPAQGSGSGSRKGSLEPSPSTIAPFSSRQTSSSSRSRSTVQVQQKSPLLIATPPPITRALVFSHPFILPLNKFLGLVSWSSGDPWESFLVVASFWALVLYGEVIILLAGPVLVVVGLMLGMYSRRFSPLSSTSVTGEKIKGHTREKSEGSTRHQKSLDEIVDTLNVFTSRCNILLDPLLQLTDFLSTQQTATSASTRPALTTLLWRIIVVLPLWILLAHPARIITSRRVTMVLGTLILTWHSRPARVSRTILWRSLAVRRSASIVTGLSFHQNTGEKAIAPPLPPRRKSQRDIASSLAIDSKPGSVGIRFTFTVYENQRRWLGLGWTPSMYAYERAAWTDDHHNPSSPKDVFELPTVQGAGAKWQWVPGSEWKIEGAAKSSPASDGWIYYDGKACIPQNSLWNDGRRQDGWGRYTRRRKWYRDAELVETTPDTTSSATELPADDVALRSNASSPTQDCDDSVHSKRHSLFTRYTRNGSQSNKSIRSDRDDEDDLPTHPDPLVQEADWQVGDDMRMGLG